MYAYEQNRQLCEMRLQFLMRFRYIFPCFSAHPSTVEPLTYSFTLPFHRNFASIPFTLWSLRSQIANNLQLATTIIPHRLPPVLCTAGINRFISHGQVNFFLAPPLPSLQNNFKYSRVNLIQRPLMYILT
jgi:hypothetical protein